MAISTADQSVSTLPIVGRGFTSKFFFAYDSIGDDTVRFDSSTLLNDTVISTVATTGAISGDGAATALTLNVPISANQYFDSNSFNMTNLSGTIALDKLNTSIALAPFTNAFLISTDNTTTISPVVNQISDFQSVATGIALFDNYNSSTNTLSLRTISAGTNCNIVDNGDRLTISSTAGIVRHLMGTVTTELNQIFSLDLDTGNVFDLTLTTASPVYIIFNNMGNNPGMTVFLRLTIPGALPSITFEDCQFADDEDKFNFTSDTTLIGIVDDIDEQILFIGSNYGYA